MEEILLRNNLFDETNQLNVSLNHSGYVRNTVSALDIGLQFDSVVVCPKIHKNCDCINEIKSACPKVFVKCNISTQASHIAVQAVYNTFNRYLQYLS